MADPVTIGTVAATLWPEFLAAGAVAPELVGGTLAAMAPEMLAVGGATAAGAAGLAAPTIAEAMSPLAMEAGGGATAEMLSPVASEMYGGDVFGNLAGKDRFAAMLDKYGPKAAQMLASDLNEPSAPMPQAGGPRMGGQQAQAAPVTVDYGGAVQRKPAGGAAMLGINDDELKRLLMSLRGY